MYKDLSPQLQRINLCFSKENTRTKQNPSLKDGGYWVYILRDILGFLVEAKGASTTWANMVHGPTAQKTVLQQLDRFWTFTCFDDSRRFWMNLGLKPVPLEAPWNYISIHINIIQNGLRMRPGHWFLCGLLLDSEADSNSTWIGPPTRLGCPCWSTTPPDSSPTSSSSSPWFLTIIKSLGSNLFSNPNDKFIWNDLTL